jgi:O-antigen/teichoic acid export membrane protein
MSATEPGAVLRAGRGLPSPPPRAVLKNVGSNWTLSGLQIVVFLVLARYTLDRLGLDGSGVWGAIVAVLGPLWLLVLGIPMASVRFVSAHIAKKEHAAANRVLATCFAVTGILGLTALTIAGLLYFGFEHGLLQNEAWQLGAGEVFDARVAYAVLALHVALGFVLTLPYGVYDAHHDFVVRNLIQAGGLLLRLGATLLFLALYPTLTALALVQLGVAAAEFAAAVLVSRRRHTGVRLRLGEVDWSLVRPILRFSSFAMLLNVGALLAFRLDALVLGASLDQTAIAIYDYGNKVFEPFLGLVLAIGMVVLPLATQLEAQGRTHELAPILRKWTKVASSVVFLVGLWLLVLGPAFLRWWVGPEFRSEMGDVLRILVVSFLAFLPVRGVALPILMGMGRQARPALALLVMGLANLGLSIALVGPLGLHGVAIGTAVPNVAFAVYVLAVALRTVGGPVRPVLVDGLLRPFVGASLPAALLLLADDLHRVEGFLPLLLSGLGYVACWAVVQVVYVWRGDPDMDLWTRVRGRLVPGRS